MNLYDSFSHFFTIRFIGLGSLSVKNMTKTYFQWMHTVATHSPTYLHYVWCLGPLGVISVEIVELFTFTLPCSTSACCLCVCVLVCTSVHVFCLSAPAIPAEVCSIITFQAPTPVTLPHVLPSILQEPFHSFLTLYLSCILQRNTYWCQ